MAFKTTLFKLLNSADRIDIEGYTIDDDGLTFHIRELTHLSHYAVTLPDGNYTEIVFFDQDVKVDSFGLCKAREINGAMHEFGFWRLVPIRSEHLL